MAQAAIDRAEQGDYSEVNRVLLVRLFSFPQSLRGWEASEVANLSTVSDGVMSNLQLLKHPFAEAHHDDLVKAADNAMLPMFRRQPGSPFLAAPEVKYDGLAPPGMACAGVTCSS